LYVKINIDTISLGIKSTPSKMIKRRAEVVDVKEVPCEVVLELATMVI